MSFKAAVGKAYRKWGRRGRRRWKNRRWRIFPWGNETTKKAVSKRKMEG